MRIAEIVDRLRASGEEILDTDLARVSPLCRAHIIPTGTYSFEPEIPGVGIAQYATVKFRTVAAGTPFTANAGNLRDLAAAVG